MKPFRPILIALCVLGAGPSAPQQVSEAELLLGGIRLQLGMDEEDVLRRLGAVYNLTYNEFASDWAVARRGAPNSEPIGSVAFQDGELHIINKTWGRPSEDQTAAGVGQAFHDALSSIGGDGTIFCTIRTVRVASPSEGVMTMLNCGGHLLIVSVQEAGYGVVSHSISRIR